MAKGVIRKTAVKPTETAADKPILAAVNPVTTLIIADLALRGGGQLLRRAVNRTLLGSKNSKPDAANPGKGQTIAQSLISSAIVRIATRSVPGAIVVGGGLLAKMLYDRRRSTGPAKAKHTTVAAKQAEKDTGES